MTKRTIDPIVSTDWLEDNLGTPGLVIVDVRETQAYQEGHLVHSVSVPFSPTSDWSTPTEEALIGLPPEADLFKVMGDCGINPDSKVVVVGAVDEAPTPPFALANATRVADTLIYAGLADVAILDGGYPKWAREGKETTQVVVRVSPATYSGAVHAETFVSTQYVKDRIGKCLLLDNRDPDVYFGVTLEPWVQEAGHIPSAKSLPTPWIFRADGSYRPPDVLGRMATGVIGEAKDEEIIVYCGVGGYESSWWFVLTQILAYPDVKLYEGAAKAWVMENEMVAYTWE